MQALLALSLAFLLGSATAQEPQEAGAAKPKQEFQSVTVYPLATCVVSGKKLDPDKAKAFEAGGHAFRTCCEKCEAKVKANPDEFAKKLNEAVIAQQLANYPLKVCAVSGKPLGSMGEPVKLVVDGQLIQLCCKSCTSKATAKKAEITQRIQSEAYAAQKATYTAKKCPASNDELTKEHSLDLMIGTTLVRVCCDDCIDDIKKDPSKVLAVPAPAKEADKTEKKEQQDGKKQQVPAAAAAAAPQAAGGCCGDSKPKAGPECCGDDQKAGEKKDAGCCGDEKKATEKSDAGCCGDEKKAPAKPAAEKKSN